MKSRFFCYCAILAAIATACSVSTTASPPPQTPQASRVQPWHVRLARKDLLKVWDRMKALPIPGVPDDLRFQIEGQAFYVIAFKKNRAGSAQPTA